MPSHTQFTSELAFIDESRVASSVHPTHKVTSSMVEVAVEGALAFIASCTRWLALAAPKYVWPASVEAHTFTHLDHQ